MARKPGAGNARRGRNGAARRFAVGLMALLLATLAFPEQPPETGAAAVAPAVCRFCGAPSPGSDFCPHCGRLSRIASPDSGSRFWGDVPYVLAFPPQENAPEVGSEISSRGLVQESVRYASGDRYEMKMEKRGARITGRVGWLKGGKETDYSAEMEDQLDAGQRLIARQVNGKLKGSSDTYLYRKLDYRYAADGRLDRIEFTTSLYGDASDWKKSPAAWMRHSQGEILLRRDEAGALLRIETMVREGRRSLRGEPEYGEPRRRVESVVRDGDQILRLNREQE